VARIEPEQKGEPPSVRAFAAQDEPRVLAILQLAFDAWADEIDASPGAFFEWKHRRGSFGASTLIVVEFDGELAGFAAYMPWRFTAGARALSAMRGVDYAIHPDFRRRGASAAVRAVADELLATSLIWANPNELTRRGGVKVGRHIVGTIPRYARPSRGLLAGLRSVPTHRSSARERPAIDAPAAAEILADGEFIEDVLRRAPRPAGRWMTDKSLEFLRWRYGHFDAYRAVRCDSTRTGRGFAIFRSRRLGGFSVLDVCELIATGNRSRASRALLALVAGSTRADFTSCAFASALDAGAHGFMRASRGSNLLAHPLREGLLPDPTRLGSWALSRGDIELL
jgi:hypothetical protein